MAIGSGLSATLGFAQESTPGVPVPVTRFFEFNDETLALKKTIAQGQGVRGGAYVRRGARRNYVARQAAGDVDFDVTSNGLGLIIQNMIGSFSTTATSIGGGLYQQIHNTGSLQGKTFTTQVVKPDVTGVLAPQAFTYVGCKITAWELAAQQGGLVTLKLTIDALDEATPSNGVQSTTLTAASTAGATSLSATASIPTGTWITVGSGLTAEVVQTTNVSGSGPYILTVPAMTYAHAIGSYVGSASGTYYAAGTGLQAASYTSTVTTFDFHEGALVAGGVTSVVSGVWTLTGSQTLGVVRSVDLKGSNPLKVDRWALGSAVRSEQLENNWRDYTGTASIEYNSRFMYDVYAADAALALKLTFTTPQGAVLQVYVPVAFQEDGASPNVSGPDVVIPSYAFTMLDDGVNGAMQFVYTSTDSTV